MVTFDSASLAILSVAIAAMATIVSVIIESIITLHSSKIKTIQERNKEFIEFTKEYYIPLATKLAAIKTETDPKYNKVRPNVLFFILAKYLSFFESMRNKGIWFIFPKPSQEFKIDNCSIIFNDTVNSLIFNDNKEAIEHLIDYYSKNPKFLIFIKDLEKMPEYKNFESICNNKEIIKKIYSNSKEFSDTIYEGVIEAYKKWYKFEFKLLKWLRKKQIERNTKKETSDILELQKKIHTKRS